MNTIRCSSALVGALCAVTGFAPATLLAQDSAAAKIGDLVADFAFDTPIGHQGRTHLVDLFGHPVIVAGWRTHLVDGLHAGREATRLLQKYRTKGLVAVMTDRNPWRTPTSRDGAATFWYQVAGTLPYLTSIPGAKQGKHKDLPIEWSVPRDDRSVALIGVDGRLVAVGRIEKITDKEKRSDFRLRLRKLVAAEIKRRQKGWGTDPLVVKARSLAFGQDQLAKAMATLVDTGTAAEQGTAAKEISRHFKSRMKTLQFLLQQGRFIEAKAYHQKLRKAVKGHVSWTGEVGSAGEVLTGKEGKREMALDKALTKMLQPLVGEPRKGKASIKLLAQLRTFAAKHADTKVGARAKRMDYMVHSLLASSLGMKWKDVAEKTKKLMKKGSG